MAKSHKKDVDTYVEGVLKGKLIVGKEIVLACARYKADLNETSSIPKKNRQSNQHQETMMVHPKERT